MSGGALSCVCSPSCSHADVSTVPSVFLVQILAVTTVAGSTLFSTSGEEEITKVVLLLPGWPQSSSLFSRQSSGAAVAWLYLSASQTVTSKPAGRARMRVEGWRQMEVERGQFRARARPRVLWPSSAPPRQTSFPALVSALKV